MSRDDRSYLQRVGDGTARLLSPRDLRDRVTEARNRSERIVFTNGCFDILHVGHLRYLVEAARAGDRLIVGLNSDRSVTELKGEGRPLVSEIERAELLLALRPVDWVVIFDEPTPIDLIRFIRPDVLVKGGDYDPSAGPDSPGYIVGSDLVRSWNGQVRTIPFVQGRSTSNLVARLGRDSS